MTTPITIDQLPEKIHTDWAENQEFFELKYIDESRFIPYHTEVTVTTPRPSKFDQLFEIKNQSFALFAPPPNFRGESNRFFSFQIFPSLSMDQLIAYFVEEFYALLLRKQSNGQSRSHLLKSKETIVRFLETIRQLNELLDFIFSRINQFAKG